MKTLLWLDDLRDPSHVDYQKIILAQNFKCNNIIWVKNYQSFKDYILDNGLPNAISFDHDLADFYEDENGNQREYTGYDCAKWLVYNHYNLKDVQIAVHSANPIGAENIIFLINNWKKHYNLCLG